MLELEMPSDFPGEPYDSVWKCLEGLGGEYYRTGEESKYQAWQQWLSAWIGMAYRFRSCAEHDDAFAKSIEEYGDNPGPPENYYQDRELFGFFRDWLVGYRERLLRTVRCGFDTRLQQLPIYDGRPQE